MEDRENCTTELFLQEDGTVVLGDTDGPLWTDAIGEWLIKPDTNDFVMTVTKKFGAGHDNSDMGEFEYELERIYQGDMTEVGESVAITGKMLCEDPLTGKEQEVGFFNMIDGTDVRLERTPEARSGTRDETDFQAAMRRSNSSNRVSGHDGAAGMVVPQPVAAQAQAQPAGFGDPYGYGGQPQQQQQQQQPQPAMSAYEEQLRMQQQGYGGQPQQQDPYGGGYGQQQQQQAQDPYGGGYGQQQQQQQQQPSFGAYGEQNFGSQTPGVSQAFGGDGQETYGIYAEDDPGYQEQHQTAPVDPSDPYGYGQMQNGGEDPGPPLPNLNPYGQDGYGQDAWRR
ncbi:MAG: hypothetical protein SGARI_002461 [Bacillariaceae sp.]